MNNIFFKKTDKFLRIFIIIYILCLIFSTPHSLKAQCNEWKQNLIHNAGFEDINFPDNSHWYRSFEYLEVWNENSTIDKCEDEQGGEHSLYEHSPDWFNMNISTNHLNESFKNGNIITYQLVYPHDGESFAGMSKCELIEQKFFDSQPLTKGNYILSFFIRPINGSYEGFGGFHYPYYNTSINVYFAKDKIRYNDWNCKDCEKCGCGHDNKYCNKQSNTIKIINIPITSDYYPVGTWSKVEVNISIEEDYYDWIGFEIPDECSTYFLLDDFSLVNGCINGCSSTDGIKSVCCNNIHNETQPLTFWGLNNLTEFNLQLFMSNGQWATVLDIINPPYEVSWNGQSSQGAEFSNADYLYRLILTNDCGTATFESDDFQFVKSGVFNDISWPFFDYTPVSKPPDPCCSSQPDLYIYNQTLIQDQMIGQPLLYKAIHNIYAQNDIIPPGNEVIFQAGNEIEIGPDFDAEYGSDFTAEIVSCEAKTSNKYLNIAYVNYDYYVGDTVQLYCFNEGYTEPIEYYWDFGNGSFSRERNPIVIYNDTGIYEINLTITDADKISADANKKIEIEVKPSIYGALFESALCGGTPAAGDTLVLKQNGLLVDSVTPAVTDENGYFAFNPDDLYSLNDTLTYTLETRNGFAINLMQALTIEEWEYNSPLSLDFVSVNKEWVAKYAHTDTSYNISTAIDLNENIYITGPGFNTYGQADYVTIKYSPSGEELWVSRYNCGTGTVDYPSDIAVDDSGNCYVTGISCNQITTIKYSSDGSQVWINKSPGGGMVGTTNILTIDETGDILVGSQAWDAVKLFKYNSDGDELWNRSFNIEDIYGYKTISVKTDISGDIILAGYYEYYTNSAFFLLKYTPDGDLSWSKVYSRGGVERLSDMIMDTNGDIYLTGYDNSSNYSVTKCVTLKYNSSGDMQWEKLYEDRSFNYAGGNDIAIDRNNNLYVSASRAFGQSILKYNNDGVLQWEAQNSNWIFPTAGCVVVDSIGNVYNVGSTSPSLNIIKYDNDGNLLWTGSFTENEDNVPYDMILSPNDNLYITGRTGISGWWDFLTLKYAQCPATASSLKINENADESGDYILTDRFLNVYPNPNNGNMQVSYELPENVNGRFELYDVLGKLVYERVLICGVNTFSISGNNIEKGIYIYKAIASDKQLITDKIIVIK